MNSAHMSLRHSHAQLGVTPQHQCPCAMFGAHYWDSSISEGVYLELGSPQHDQQPQHHCTKICQQMSCHFTHSGYHDRFSHIDPEQLWHILHWSTQVCGVAYSERLCLHTQRALMFLQKVNANHNWSFDFCHHHHVWPNVLVSAKLQIQLHCA